MLSPKEQTLIDDEIKKYPERKSACIDALLIVQNRSGYVSDDALKDVADYFHMSPTELDSIATFYNRIFRKPVGQKVIRICDSASCFIMGYERIKEEISKHLKIDWGETTADNCYTLISTQCLGICEHAPAMMINDELFTDLTPITTARIIGFRHGSNDG